MVALISNFNLHSRYHPYLPSSLCYPNAKLIPNLTLLVAHSESSGSLAASASDDGDDIPDTTRALAHIFLALLGKLPLANEVGRKRVW